MNAEQSKELRDRLRERSARLSAMRREHPDIVRRQQAEWLVFNGYVPVTPVRVRYIEIDLGTQ